MTRVRQDIQDAVYALLNHASVTDIAPVYQHVPDNTDPPVVIIGTITLEGDGAKSGAPLDRATIEIITLTREPAREALHELMAAVRDRLEGAELTAPDSILSPLEFQADDDDLLDDGVTYVGTQRFALWAQPA